MSPIADLTLLPFELELVGVFKRKGQAYFKGHARVHEVGSFTSEPVFRDVVFPISLENYEVYKSALEDIKAHNKTPGKLLRYAVIRGSLEVVVEENPPF